MNTSDEVDERRQPRRDQLLDHAFAAFEAAMSEASRAALWLLHGILEKHRERLLWGGWREDGALCPLSALVLGDPGDQGTVAPDPAVVSAERLARHGFAASDFYVAWDAGLVEVRTLLRAVDEHLTRRTLGGPRRAKPERAFPSSP